MNFQFTDQDIKILFFQLKTHLINKNNQFTF